MRIGFRPRRGCAARGGRLRVGVETLAEERVVWITILLESDVGRIDPIILGYVVSFQFTMTSLSFSPGCLCHRQAILIRRKAE